LTIAYFISHPSCSTVSLASVRNTDRAHTFVSYARCSYFSSVLSRTSQKTQTQL